MPPARASHALTLRVTRRTRPRPWLSVEVQDAKGRRGRGEAAPLSPFSREDVGACERALAEVPERLHGVDLYANDNPAIAFVVAVHECGLDAVPSACFALETALLDLMGRQRGLPAAAIMRDPARPAYDRVPVNAMLAAEPTETLPERAAALAAAGYPALKIKLRARDDAGFARELAALREVRARLPPPYEIRLDPNGIYRLDEARRRLEALAPIAPRFVEQPVSARDLPLLGPCAVPWAADESLADPALAEELLWVPGCTAFVLKPAVLGGLLRASSLALQAQGRGHDVVVTHFRDGPYALAAACALALSLREPPIACGLAPHEDLRAFGAAYGGVEIPQLARRGELIDTGGLGLGVRRARR